MLQQKIQKAREEDGFTLIELLVVILIIGILAAIALPTFLGQSDKAKDSSAKSDARNAVTQMESCVADATGDTAAAVTSCSTNTQVLGSGDSAVEVAANGVGYNVSAESDTDTFFVIRKENTAPGAFTRACGAAKTVTAGADASDTRKGKGGCPANGQW